MSLGIDFYRKIADKGYNYAYEYFKDNPMDPENLRSSIGNVVENDIRKGIFHIAKKHGDGMVKDVFGMGSSSRMIDALLQRKSIAEATYATILSDPELNKIVGNLVEYKNPLLASIQKRQGIGDKAIVMRRTAAGGGSWIADTDNLTEETGTYSQHNFTYKTLGTQGKLTRKMIAIGKSFGDILQMEIAFRVDEFKNKLDYTIIRGTSGGDANEFDGLDVLIPTTQIIPATPGTGGKSLTKDMMDQLIDESTGTPDFLVCSKTGSRIINSLVQTYQRFNDKTEIRGGMRVAMWDDYPIFKSTNIVDVAQYNNGAVSSYSGGSETAIYAINNDETWLEILTPITVVPLALVSSQYRNFDIVSDLVLVMRNYEKSAILNGVLP